MQRGSTGQIGFPKRSAWTDGKARKNEREHQRQRGNAKRCSIKDSQNEN